MIQWLDDHGAPLRQYRPQWFAWKNVKGLVIHESFRNFSLAILLHIFERPKLHVISVINKYLKPKIFSFSMYAVTMNITGSEDEFDIGDQTEAKFGRKWWPIRIVGFERPLVSTIWAILRSLYLHFYKI